LAGCSEGAEKRPRPQKVHTARSLVLTRLPLSSVLSGASGEHVALFARRRTAVRYGANTGASGPARSRQRGTCCRGAPARQQAVRRTASGAAARSLRAAGARARAASADGAALRISRCLSRRRAASRGRRGRRSTSARRVGRARRRRLALARRPGATAAPRVVSTGCALRASSAPPPSSRAARAGRARPLADAVAVRRAHTLQALRREPNPSVPAQAPRRAAPRTTRACWRWRPTSPKWRARWRWWRR